MRYEQLTTDQRSLYQQLCCKYVLEQGFKAVKKNKGAPGIDDESTFDFESCLDEELSRLSLELESWTYQPMPVRWVEIPKPGKNSGVRLLGVPCTRDRVVQATLKLLLEPILEPTFSDHSYGFRPGRNQRQAVESIQRIVQRGKEYVVDTDLSKFFDMRRETCSVEHIP
jgi:retron-type reverse transcriptase